LRGDLQFGRRQQQYLAVAAAANELVLTARAAPVYPPDAERRGIEGWVDVDLIVDATGRPKDLRVATAEPPNYFEAAALAAVAQYRFKPFELEGRVYERRARLRLRFALQ
jgi:protein TonB